MPQLKRTMISPNHSHDTRISALLCVSLTAVVTVLVSLEPASQPASQECPESIPASAPLLQIFLREDWEFSVTSFRWQVMVLACCYWETGCLGLAAGGQCAVEVEAKKPAASHLHINPQEL